MQLVLPGDSIRMGYQDGVIKKPEGTFDMWTPEDGGVHMTDFDNDVLADAVVRTVSRVAGKTKRES